MKTLHLEGCTHDAIDATLSLSFLVTVHHRFDFFVERKTSLWQSGNSAFAIPQVPIIGNDNYTPIRRRSHISLINSKSKCVLSLTFALSGYLPIQLNCDYFEIYCWGSKIMINNR